MLGLSQHIWEAPAHPESRGLTIETLMKSIKGTIAGLSVAIAALAVSSVLNAQTNLNFNGGSATVEGAVSISWNSTPNEYYEIDYADSLVDTNTGQLSGNCFTKIIHPKEQIRFG